MLPLRWVLVRDPTGRFDPQARLSTDRALAPVDLVRYYVRRWQVEVTFEETRRHLGVETQREWSDLAIARTTPILLALFSLVTLLASQLPVSERRHARGAAWYEKAVPTFTDTLALVRRQFWPELVRDGLTTSQRKRHIRKPERETLASANSSATPPETATVELTAVVEFATSVRAGTIRTGATQHWGSSHP